MAIQWIVASYVQGEDPELSFSCSSVGAKAVADLRAVPVINPTNSLQVLEEEILIIEADLVQLKAAIGSFAGK